MHTLQIFNPGHFHAALVLREPHPAISDEIYVYSEKGPDLERFLDLAASFNRRTANPTHWNLHIHTGADFLEKLIVDKKGDVVVMAGRNDTKMAAIERLNRSGFYVLADKPWITKHESLPLLRSALSPERRLSLDIMTERFEITTILQKELIAEEPVFGEIRVEDDGRPTVFKESVHHLYKVVNQRPLVRPPWYFDAEVQGEGIVDVSTHLIDMTHWMLFPGAFIDFERDIRLDAARRWSTPVPLEKYTKITKEDRFPPSLQHKVKNEILDYYCNGELLYRVRDVPVHVRVVWNLEIPEGGGDTHHSLIRGTRSDLLIRQLPERGFKVELLVVPHGNAADIEKALRSCLTRWEDRYPGLSLAKEEDMFLIGIPEALRTSHEEHFCQVRDMFLDYLDRKNCPAETRACILAKYTLLAEARKLALASPFEPLKK